MLWVGNEERRPLAPSPEEDLPQGGCVVVVKARTVQKGCERFRKSEDAPVLQLLCLKGACFLPNLRGPHVALHQGGHPSPFLGETGKTASVSFVCACTCVGMLVEARGLNVERLSHDLYDYNVVISTLFFETVSH